MQAEAAHQKSKYEKLNKAFTKRENSKEEAVNIADSLDSNYSSSSESNNYSTKTGKISIAYDSDSADDGEISSFSNGREDNNWLDSCRDALIIDKSKTNSKSKLKEQKLGSNNLDASLHDAYILNTLRNPTNKKDKQTKSYKKLKHVHLSPVIFVKLVIPSGNKDTQSKNRLVKYLVNLGASESIITKEKAEKLPVKNTKHER